MHLMAQAHTKSKNRRLAKPQLKDIDRSCVDLSKAGELESDRAYEAIKNLCN
jgi:hypothetical protein